VVDGDGRRGDRRAREHGGGRLMRIGIHFSCSSVAGADWPDIYEAALEQAELADELGYDAAVVSEHHFKKEGWIPSPFVLCGAIAARTTRLRVGTDITILPFQH